MEFVESLSLLHLQQIQHDSERGTLNQNYINSQNDLIRHHQSHHHHRSLPISDSLFGSSAEKDLDHYYFNQHSFSHKNITNLTYKSTVNDEASTSVLIEPTHPGFDELPLRLPIWGVVILIFSYALVFLMGVVGNCCVLFIVTKLKRMKTVTNYFIFNLAVADLLVLLFCLLPNLVSNIFIPWVLGPILCKIVPYIQGVSVCASIYFLVAISLERCVSIQWPFKYQITKEKAKIIISSIWLWSCILALPWALFFHSGAFDEDNPHLEFCIEKWPELYEDWQTYYFLFGNLFILYSFPLGLILICYLAIWFRVYRRPIPSDCYHTAIELIHQRSKTAVIKMLIVVVLIFALSWLPLYVIIIRVKFGSNTMTDFEASAISIIYPIAQWLLCFNSSVNPIIYSFLNTKFRNAFVGIIKRSEKKHRVRFKHKSPTVNILLKRFSTYRVTTMSNNNDENSYDSI